MSGTLSRELTARIVKDLARASRSVPAIASRYRVPESTVVALRDFYGPGIPQLIDAAEKLRRVSKPVEGAPPVGPLAVSGTAEDVAPQPEPEPEPEEPEAKPRRSDGLTSAERVDCRSWCAATGREVGSFGMIARDVVDAWDAAGRPLALTVDVDDVIDAEVVEGTEADTVFIEQLRSAADLLDDVGRLIPFAAEHLHDEVSDFLAEVARVSSRWQAAREAQHLVGRAQTALTRRGVEISEQQVREVLAELELV